MNFLRSLSLRRAVVAVAALALSVATAKADIIIDDFSSPASPTNYAIAPDVNPLTITSNIGGGITRTVTLAVTSPTSPGVNALTGSVGGGLFTASFNVFSSGTAQIAYSYAAPANFIPNVPAGGVVGNLVFAGAGDSGFAANIPLTITIATSTGNLTFNGTLPLTPAISTVSVGLAGFTGSGNLASVTGVTVDLVGGQAADLIFDSIGVTTPDAPPPTNGVPAPAGVLLALAALPVLGLRRALRKSA